MHDSLKIFFIALMTSVAAQLLLGPYILKLQGVLPIEQVSVANKVDAGTSSAAPVPIPEPKLAAPNLEGMPVAEARERWRARDLQIVEDGERDGSGAAPGTILSQRPAPGAELSSKEIRVVVAGKSEDVEVPKIVGEPVATARQRLVEAGFQVPDPSREGSTEPADTVLRQSPAGGEQAKRNSIVRLVIAEPAGVAVPKFVGMYLSQAKQALESTGLNLGKVRRVEHAERREGYVLRQTPAPGEQVPPGTEVELVVVAPD